MTDVPILPADSSLAFLREGYPFGHRRFVAHASDAFRTRLLGRPVLFLRGAEAARFFYDGDRFSRGRAVPRSVLHSLQDEGSVQTLSGEAHRGRKALFTAALDGLGAADLAAAFEARFWAAAVRWPERRELPVLAELSAILTCAALDWLGLEATAEESAARTRELTAMIEGAGSFGPRNWRGRARRLRTERWARAELRRLRDAPPGSRSRAIELLLAHRDRRGRALSEDELVVELLNLLRPVTAIARFVAFAVLALHRHPEWRRRVVADERALAAFARELRRATPFFPVIGGRATRELEWRGIGIAPGDWVVLDLFATNRHPGEWDSPERFDPGRFFPDPSAEPAAEPVAQGAGSFAEGHRCPGEPATADLLALATGHLARMSWSVPRQDLGVDLRRIPALPGRRGMVIRVAGRV